MRHLSLRQIEAFKAVIETGTISRAANVLRVSQPAMSKMIANLEAEAHLVLFDRQKGRLAPTEQGMRLYDEIDRIFTGVRQVENAIEAIQRDDQGHIAIGVMPTLSGRFIQQATTRFLQNHPRAFCVIETRNSQRITEWLLTRKLDIGLVMFSMDFDNPYLASESLAEHPLVCIMPAKHALAVKKRVQPADLDGLPFVSFDPETSVGQRVGAMITTNRISPKFVLVAKDSQTLCEFVAAGHGVSLVHPLMAKRFGGRLVTRPFEPAIPFDFKICRNKDCRNTHLVADFVGAIRETARILMEEERR